MATREVITLNEATPELTVPQTGDTYKLPRATEIDSQLANTVAMLLLSNTAGSISVFRVDATPEGAVTANIGSIAVDATGGKIYLKETGAGNTGWVEFGAGAGLTGTTTATYTFVGVNAGGGTASGNVCVGDDAGGALTTGAQNTIVGANAADANLIGYRNIAIGYDAMGSAVMTSATGYNVAVGIEALDALTSGTHNIAIGRQAGDIITTGANNVAIGGLCMSSPAASATGNICIGYNAGNNVNNGNTFIGHNSGLLVQNDNNTAVGYQSMYSAQAGAANCVAIGYEAGYDADDGCVFIGYQAGKSLTAPANIMHIHNADSSTPLLMGEFANKNLSINLGAGQFGGGTGVITIATATAVPTSDPVGGGILYVEAGALKYRGTSGTITGIAPA